MRDSNKLRIFKFLMYKKSSYSICIGTEYALKMLQKHVVDFNVLRRFTSGRDRQRCRQAKMVSSPCHP